MSTDKEKEMDELINLIGNGLCPNESTLSASFLTKSFCFDDDFEATKQALEGLSQFPKFMRVLERVPVKRFISTSRRTVLMTVAEEIARQRLGDIAAEKILSNPQAISTLIYSIGGAYDPNDDSLYLNLLFAEKAKRRLGDRSFRFSKYSPPVPLQSASANANIGLLIHEFTHVIDWKLLTDDSLCSFVAKIAEDAIIAGRVVSMIIGNDQHEWLAETMTAYLLRPDELKDFDAMSHFAMKTILDTLGKGESIGTA